MTAVKLLPVWRRAGRRLRRGLLIATLAAACGGDPPIGPPADPDPALLAMATQPPAAAVNGQALSPAPRVRLRAADGAVSRRAGITVTAELAAGTGTLAGATATTDANGVAAFTGLTVTGAVGAYTLRFTASGLTSVDAAALTLQAGPPAALGFVTAPAVTGTSGTALGTIVVELRDVSGNPAPQAGITVTASLPGGGLTLLNNLATTDAAGRATFGTLILAGATGNYTLRFSAPGLAPLDAAQPLALAAGAAFALGIVTQPAAAAVSGAPLAVQPVVQLRDAWGNPVALAGRMVRASLVNAGPALAGDSVATDANGRATFTGLQLSGTAGSWTLRFAATGLQPAVATAPTVLAAGAAAALLLTTLPPPDVVNGAVLTVQPVVQVVDASQNPVAAPNVTVTASIIGLGATISGGSATTDAGGAARFSTLALTGTTGAYRFVFAGGGFTPDTAPATVFLLPGAVSQLAFVTAPPAATQNGIALAGPPQVRIRDQSGNNIAQAGVIVRARLTSAGATLAEDSAATAGTGIAVFTGLTITGTTGDYTLAFSATGTGDLTSGTITVVPGPAAGLAVVTQPSTSAQSGVALTTQPVVRLVDVSGNAVAQAGTVITASVIGGGATLANATATTDATGAATFSGLSLTGAAGAYTLRFTAGTFVVNAAAATVLP